MLTGEQHFAEIFFHDVYVPASCLVGVEGKGWDQVLSELAFERSGPERFLTSFPLLAAAVDLIDAEDDRALIELGRATSQFVALRRLSRSVAGMLDRGEEPRIEASIVKDYGTGVEQSIPDIVRRFADIEELAPSAADFVAAFASTQANAPSFSLRGGTREILRGIIARGLGLR